MSKKRWIILSGALALVVALVLGLIVYQGQRTAKTSTTFVMSTTVSQMAYGLRADAAMAEVEKRFRAFEDEFSLFNEDSDIAKINAAAGQQPVAVSGETYDLLRRSVALSSQSGGAFDITIAPLTLLWGITTDHPKVPAQTEIDAVLPLIGDNSIQFDDTAKTVFLPTAGQGIDLGGIAKGTACTVAAQVYDEYGIKSAILNIGGNVYVRGHKPDGSLYRIGFRTPLKDATTYIASVALEDQVMAVSGGYERYFEENGVRYHHILSGRTGYPAESDIVSVGAIAADGTVADFYSTTMFIWGSQKVEEFMRDNTEVAVIMLTSDGRLVVSSSLKDSFELNEEQGSQYTVVFI